MATVLRRVRSACRRCGNPQIQRFLELRGWGGNEINKPTGDPYCSDCTPEELAAWDRAHPENPEG